MADGDHQVARLHQRIDAADLVGQHRGVALQRGRVPVGQRVVEDVGGDSPGHQSGLDAVAVERVRDAGRVTGDLDLEPQLRIEMFDLLSALAGVFDRMQSRTVHDVVREAFTVEEKMSLIEERVGAGGTHTFEELFAGDTIKMEVIVTFIAILEMVKRGRLHFMQTEAGGPIWIQHPGVDEEVGDQVDLVTPDEDHADEGLPEELPGETTEPAEDTNARENES